MALRTGREASQSASGRPLITVNGAATFMIPIGHRQVRDSPIARTTTTIMSTVHTVIGLRLLALANLRSDSLLLRLLPIL